MASSAHCTLRISKLLSLLLACGALLVMPRDAAATPILSVDPTPVTIATAGDIVSVDVLIAGAVDLYGYQFTIEYDPAFLSVNGVTEGTFFTNAYPGPGTTSFFSGIDDPLGGNITFVLNTLVGPVAGVSGGGSLASIEFTTLAAGDTTVFVSLDPLNGDGFVFSDVASEVPEPATVLLVGAGSALITARRTRRRVRRS